MAPEGIFTGEVLLRSRLIDDHDLIAIEALIFAEIAAAQKRYSHHGEISGIDGAPQCIEAASPGKRRMFRD